MTEAPSLTAFVTHVFSTTLKSGEEVSVSVDLPADEPVPAVTDSTGNVYVYEGIARDDDN